MSIITIEHLPQEHQAFLHAISHKDNINAQRILKENPTININMTTPDNGIQYTTIACYEGDNEYMLQIFIDQGLDTSHFGNLLHWVICEKYIFQPDIFKIIVAHGAFNQLNTEQKFVTFTLLLLLIKSLSTTEQYIYIKHILHTGLDIFTTKQWFTALITVLANNIKITELSALKTNYELRSDIFTIFINALTILKSSGLDFTLKAQDFKELLIFLASEGNIDLTKYLIMHNNGLSASDFESIIAHARVHHEDPAALDFIDKLAAIEPIHTLTDQQQAIRQESIAYLKQQWLTHKNKSVVKLLRRFTTIQRLLSSCTTPEVAYKIAQCDIAHFHEQKIDYVPSYKEIQERIAQKKLEYVSFLS